MLAAAVTVTVSAAVIVDGDFAGTSREHLFNANEIKTHSNKHKRLTKRFLFYSLLRLRFCSVLVPLPLQMLRLLLLATTTAAVKQVLSWF